MMHLNLLCATMKHWVPCNGQCMLSISVDSSEGLLSYTQTNQKAYDPNTIVAVSATLY